MARILAVSSFLAHGTVGLVANVAVLNALGHEIVQFPSVILSNHPQHPHTAGEQVPSAQLARMLDAIEGNGWLGAVNAVLTGYLPSPGHVAFARDAVMRVRRLNPSALYVCDPIIGDDPDGIYLDEAAARAIKESLVPIADLLTPNRFELSWLTGRSVEDAQSAASAATALPCKAVAATSIPQGDREISNVLVTPDVVHIRSAARRENVPHGTGDVFCGLMAGLLARRVTLLEAFETSDKVVQDVAMLSTGREDLELAPLQRIA